MKFGPGCRRRWWRKAEKRKPTGCTIPCSIPQPIRPAVVLRMPKFNMSSAEAMPPGRSFAAVDGAEYPYDFDPRTRQGYLASQGEKEKTRHRLADALKIITDNNYCVKCHLLAILAHRQRAGQGAAARFGLQAAPP